MLEYIEIWNFCLTKTFINEMEKTSDRLRKDIFIFLILLKYSWFKILC